MSPAAGDRFFRTDRGIDYYYDGTRWLSTTLYADPIAISDSFMPLSTSGTSGRMSAPFPGVYDLWLVEFSMAMFVNGGSALSASHKWVLTLGKQPAGSVVATINLDSGATGWRSLTTAIGALLGTTNIAFTVDFTKTGTPGTLYGDTRLAYRLVG